MNQNFIPCIEKEFNAEKCRVSPRVKRTIFCFPRFSKSGIAVFPLSTLAHARVWQSRLQGAHDVHD